jgi:hypothetical protein
MGRHSETSQFDFSDKGNMSEIEMEDTVAKLPRLIPSGGTAHTTTMKYCSVNFLRKELCRQKNSLLL